jgi:peptide/nickel transport system permease protein
VSRPAAPASRVTSAAGRPRPRARYWRQALLPLRLVVADSLALTGVVILVAVIVMALAAPYVATHDPRAIVERSEGSWLTADGGEGWRVRPALGPDPLYALGVDGARAYAAGAAGTLVRWEEGAWRPVATGVETTLRGITPTPSGALAVGDGGIVVALDGEDTVRSVRLGPARLHDVTLVDEGSAALVVGAGEAVWYLPLLALRAEGDDLAALATRLTSPIDRGMSLNAVASDVDGTAIVVGERGLALRWTPGSDGGTLEQLALPTFRDFNDVAVDAASGRGLIVGERGTLLLRDGPAEAWREHASPDARALGGAWIGSDGRALAVGRNGVVVSYDGAAWRRDVTGTERHLQAVAAVGDTTVAVGSEPFVDKLAPPSAQHWFGTDHLGRDLFSQNVYGSRIALLVGFIGATLVVLIGSNVGLLAGYYRGRTDTVLMRIVDVMYGIPFEPFAMILVLLFDPSLLIVIVAVSLLAWRTVARLIRSQVLSLAERPFVKAARIAGASDLRIMYLHIAPNVLPLVFLQLAIIVGASIIAEATLSFLGLGPPQSISWGGILHNARLSGAWRTAWWWNLPPGAFIMITVMAVFFISRALEVIANPRLRSR